MSPMEPSISERARAAGPCLGCVLATAAILLAFLLLVLLADGLSAVLRNVLA